MATPPGAPSPQKPLPRSGDVLWWQATQNLAPDRFRGPWHQPARAGHACRRPFLRTALALPCAPWRLCAGIGGARPPYLPCLVGRHGISGLSRYGYGPPGPPKARLEQRCPEAERRLDERPPRIGASPGVSSMAVELLGASRSTNVHAPCACGIGLCLGTSLDVRMAAQRTCTAIGGGCGHLSSAYALSHCLMAHAGTCCVGLPSLATSDTPQTHRHEYMHMCTVSGHTSGLDVR